MVAHEVRGPVSTICSLAATTRNSYDRLSDAERLEFLGLIEHESQQLLRTVDQASLALKIDAGMLTFDRKPVALADAIREGLEKVETGSHNVDVTVPDDIKVTCDRRWLAEVVGQLVENAVKFSPPQAPIRVNAALDAGHAVIEIQDDGPGIPADKRPDLFEMFPGWRPDGYEQQPGSGLGLFICRALVAEQRGDMDIRDSPNGGTMLRVRLPVEG